MKIINKPPTIIPAFSPAILEFERENSEISAVINIQVNDTEISVVLKRDFLNKKALFNISDVLKKSFKEYPVNASERIYVDRNLYLDYDVIYTTWVLDDIRTELHTALNVNPYLQQEHSYVDRVSDYLHYYSEKASDSLYYDTAEERAEVTAKVSEALYIPGSISYLGDEYDKVEYAVHNRIDHVLESALQSNISDELGSLKVINHLYDLLKKSTSKISGKALHAVAQIGESIDYTKQRGTFRTSLDKLMVYKDYPATVTILGHQENTIVRDSNSSSYETTEIFFNFVLEYGKDFISISQDSVNINLENNDGVGITTNDGTQITLLPPNLDIDPIIKKVESRCLPDNPFYIRWINQLGGWDYWMFSFRQVIESKVKGQKTFNPTVFNVQDARSTTVEFYKEAEKIITVGAEGLNPNEFECVSKLIYSPRIEYYHLPSQSWFKLILDKGETENDTRSSAKDLEFTFILPAPQLQI